MSVLSLPEVSKVFSKNYVSVHVDEGEMAKDDPRHAVAKRHNSKGYHPTMVFLDASGKEVARVSGGLRTKEDAFLLDRYISGKHYLKGDFRSFKSANS